jgi:hypothetical protein
MRVTTGGARRSGVGRDAAQRGGGFFGRDDVDHHTGATLEPCLRDEVRPDVDVPVVLARVLVWRRVEPDVERDVAERRVEMRRGVAQRDADGGERRLVRVLQVQLVTAGDDQELVRRSAPVRADDGDVVVRERDPLAGRQLGLDRGAEHASAGEACERPLLVEDLAGHERETEQLAVRVLERCAGLAAVVDDGLGVADVGGAGVVDEAPAEHLHELDGVVVVEIVETGVVLARVHEHLVDAGRVGHHVDRPEVAHDEAVVALERRVAVRDHADVPAAALVDGLERGRRLLLVARAERAGAAGLGLDVAVTRGERVRSLCSCRNDRHPPPGELVQTHLAHSEFRIRPFADACADGPAPERQVRR